MSTSPRNLNIIAVAGLTVLAAAFIFRVVYRPANKLTNNNTSAVLVAAKSEFDKLVLDLKANPRDPKKHIAMGDFLMRVNSPKKAAAEFAIAGKLEPASIDFKVKLADAFLAAKEYDASESVYLEVVKNDPKNLTAWQGLTSVLNKQGRFYEAMHTIRKGLALDPNNPSTHLLMAKSALEYAVQFPNPENHAGELDFARSEFERLAKLLPNDAEVQYHLGRAYVGLHNKKDGVASLWKAHKLQPNNQEMGQMLVIVLRAMNDVPTALNVLSDLIKADPGNPPTNDLYGQTILQTKLPDKNTKAIECFARAAKNGPRNPLYWQHLGDAQIQANDYKGAAISFEKCVEINNNLPYPYQRLALIYTRLGDRQKAKIASKFGSEMEANDQLLRRLQDLSQKHPENIKLHELIAKRYADMKRLGPARDEYLTILKLDPTNKNVPEAIRKAAAAFPQGR